MRRFILLALLAGHAIASPAHAEGSRQTAAELIQVEGRESVYEQWGYADAMRAGDRIYVSGVVAVLQGEGTYEARYARGLEQALGAIDRVLQTAGASLDDVVDMTSFHTDLARQLETAIAVRKRVMAKPHAPWTAVGTPALATPLGVTEIKVVAWAPDRAN